MDFSILGPPFNTAGNAGGDKALRLKEGIERFLVTAINNPAGAAKAQSELAVMWDLTNIVVSSGNVDYNHVPGGGNVLYMDGHVKFLKYEAEGKFPINAGFATVLYIIGGQS